MKRRIFRRLFALAFAALLAVGLSLLGAQAGSVAGEAMAAGSGMGVAMPACNGCGGDTQPAASGACVPACVSAGQAVISGDTAATVARGNPRVGAPSSSATNRAERPDPYPPRFTDLA